MLGNLHQTAPSAETLESARCVARFLGQMSLYKNELCVNVSPGMAGLEVSRLLIAYPCVLP